MTPTPQPLTAEELADIKRRHALYEESRPRAPGDSDYMQAFVMHGQRAQLLATISSMEAKIVELRGKASVTDAAYDALQRMEKPPQHIPEWGMNLAKSSVAMGESEYGPASPPDGVERDELVCLACCGFSKCPLEEAAAKAGVKLDCKEGFLDCRADAILAAGYRKPVSPAPSGEAMEAEPISGNVMVHVNCPHCRKRVIHDIFGNQWVKGEP